MANTIEFILKLKDLLSGGFQKAGTTAQTAFNKADHAIQRTQRNLTTAKASVSDLNKRLDDLKKTRDTHVNFSDIRRANREVDKLERSIDRMHKLGLRRRNAGGMGGSLPTVIGAATLAYGATDAIKTAAAKEGNETAIDFATSGNGASTLRFVKKMTDDLGLSYQHTAEGAKTLYGAMRGGKFTLQTQHDLVQGISEAGAAMKISAENQQGAMLALSQMASKGKVAAEELRGQLGERIPGAFQLAAKAMGMTERAFNKHLEKGEILADKFLPRFAKVLHETYGVTAVKASNSATANLNRFNNAVYDLKVFLGEQLLPTAMKFIKEYLIPGAHWIKENWYWLKYLGGVVLGVTAGVKAFTTAQAALNIVMNANPVVRLVTVLGLLGVGLAKVFDLIDKHATNGITDTTVQQAYAAAGEGNANAYLSAFSSTMDSPNTLSTMATLGEKQGRTMVSRWEKMFTMWPGWKKLFGNDKTYYYNGKSYTSMEAIDKQIEAEKLTGKAVDLNKLPGLKHVGNSFKDFFREQKNPGGLGGSDAGLIDDTDSKIHAGGPRVMNFHFHDAVVKGTTIYANSAEEGLENLDDRIAESVTRIFGGAGADRN